MQGQQEPERSPIDPLRHLRGEHEVQRQLCDSLERIADGLPDEIDRSLARSSARMLETGFRAHIHFEDQQLYPILRERACKDARLLGVLDQLQAQHERDEGFALEIVDELTHLAQTGYAANPNMLGYMLRGFFEGQRRQLEWEDNLVLPMAEAVLQRSDIADLADWLARYGAAFDAAPGVFPLAPASSCGCGPGGGSGPGASRGGMGNGGGSR
jgi:hemerythrin-like domain-containing protein